MTYQKKTVYQQQKKRKKQRQITYNHEALCYSIMVL